MNNPLIQLQELFRQLSREVAGAADANRLAVGWLEVTLDARYPSQDGLYITKIRAKVAGDSISISTLYGNIIPLVGKIRASALGDPFFGILLTVSATGQVEIRLNYDPNCFSDPAFVDG